MPVDLSQPTGSKNIIPKKGPIKLTMANVKQIDETSTSSILKNTSIFNTSQTSFSINDGAQSEMSQTPAPKKFSLSKIKQASSKGGLQSELISQTLSSIRPTSTGIKDRINSSQSS